MKVEVSFGENVFSYRITLEDRDNQVSRRSFRGVAEDRIGLLRHSYRVVVPPVFSHIHPDLHATAIWFTLRPFIGPRLLLPFGVSRAFAATMAHHYRTVFPNVDSRLSPRQPPLNPRPCLLFSGGMDSAAASVLLPPDTVTLFLDRIPHLSPDHRRDRDRLIDLVQQRAACREVQKQGGDVYMLREDHEHLYTPYPLWHTDMSALLPFYLADTFGVHRFETGDVFGIFFMHGYNDGQMDGWRFRTCCMGLRELSEPAQRLEARLRSLWPLNAETRNTSDEAKEHFSHHAVLGLGKVASTAGLSEVATSKVVRNSPYQDKTWSCYYPADGNYCWRCDKCFKKILLGYIDDGKEVPSDIVDHFLGFPYLAQIFSRPGFFDWHHIWYYIFQQVRCRHWFVDELHRQAREGPDLSMLEKWYPGAREMIPASYREFVEENIDRLVGTMRLSEIRALENIDIPLLFAPELPRE